MVVNGPFQENLKTLCQVLSTGLVPPHRTALLSQDATEHPGPELKAIDAVG